MTWNEFRKLAESRGRKFQRHGKKHDIYKREGAEKDLCIERHGSTEMRKGIQKNLLKFIEK